MEIKGKDNEVNKENGSMLFSFISLHFTLSPPGTRVPSHNSIALLFLYFGFIHASLIHCNKAKQKNKKRDGNKTWR